MKIDIAKLLKSMQRAGEDAERIRAGKRAEERKQRNAETETEWRERMRSPMRLSEETLQKIGARDHA